LVLLTRDLASILNQRQLFVGENVVVDEWCIL